MGCEDGEGLGVNVEVQDMQMKGKKVQDGGE